MFKLNVTEESPPSSHPTTYIALPINLLKNDGGKGEHIQFVENVVLKTLPSGAICILDSSAFLNNEGIIADLNSFPIQTISNSMAITDGSNILNNATLLMSPSVGESHPDKDSSNATEKEKNKKTPLFMCIFCKKDFKKLSDYKKHVMWHRDFKRFKCDKCSVGFNIESNLTLHMAIHSNQNNYKCPSCNIKFQRVASLKSHLLLHQVDETYSCHQCIAEFEREEELLRHERTHLKDASNTKPITLVCTYCKMECDDMNAYKQHMALHVKVKKVMLKGKKPRKTHGDEQYSHVCKTCNKSFPKVSLLERHERIHSGEKPFVCHICKRGFNQKGTLQIHLTKHSGAKPFECTLCPAKFNQRGNLRMHVEKAHMVSVPGDKRYRCSQCSCIFKRLGSLNGHMRKMHSKTHNEFDEIMEHLKKLNQQTVELAKRANANVNPPTSETKENNQVVADTTQNDDSNVSNPTPSDCSIVKLTESGADGNLRRYTVRCKKIGDISYYICNYCSKEFKKPSDLIRHIRIHTKEKPFKCDVCGSSFSLKSTLIGHMNTHRNTQTPYKCPLCSKLISSTRTLNMHMRNHKRVSHNKPILYYKCKTCYKMFKTLVAARCHKKEHLNGNVSIDPQDLVMQQPLVQTEQGDLQPVAVPKSKLPYIDSTAEKNVRPHRCQICTAAFKKSVHLRRHMMVHNGEKKYKCDRCSKLFYTGSSLREHMKFHMGIKNHSCKVCGKKFVTVSLLRRHTVTHATDKPYICPYCDKRFKSVVLCRKHINIHKKDVDIQLCNLKENVEAIATESSISPERTDISSPICDNSLKVLTENLEQNSDGVNQDLKFSKLVKQTRHSEEVMRKTFIIRNENIVVPKSSQPVTIDPLLQAVGLQHSQITDHSRASKTEVLVSESATVELQGNLTVNNDLPLTENINLHTVYPHLKLQNGEPLLLTSLNDIQDSNILFDIDNFNQLETTNEDYFNANAFTTQVINGGGDVTNISKKSLKTVSVPIQEFHTKRDLDQSSLLNNLITNATLYPNMTFANQNETNINITVNIDGVQSNLLNSSLVLNPAPQPNLESPDLQDPNKVTVDSTLPTTTPTTTNYLCTTCLRMFSTLNSFENHQCMEKQTNEVLETQGNESESLEIASKDLNTPELVKCTVPSCGRYLDLTLLPEHMKSHQNKAKNICTYCEKGFKKPSDLNRHLRTHTGERPFPCTMCDKKFSLKSTLESHYRTHNPLSKEHKCEVCNALFITKASLKVHLLKHTEKKPHQCSFCPMRFRTIGHKRSHEATKHDPVNPKKSTPKPKIMDVLLSSFSDNDKQKQRSVQLPKFTTSEQTSTVSNVCNYIINIDI